ncbi:MAG: hypothetical protein D6805_07255, partial [Planctomycetota bacterium]
QNLSVKRFQTSINFSDLGGKTFSKTFLPETLFGKRFSDFPKTFLLGTFFKKRFHTSKNFLDLGEKLSPKNPFSKTLYLS